MQLSDRIGRRMKLHDLHVLMAVAQAGSMSKAAASLNTTQSAISRSIADLEHSIGARLLDRGPQGVEPTQYGRALLKRGVAAFDELSQGVKDIEFLSDPNAGELRIGANPSLSEGIVAIGIYRLSRRYPRVVFQVSPAGTQKLYDELRERRIELAIARMPGVVAEDDIDQHALFEEPLVVVAGIDNPWVRRRRITLADLVNEPWTWAASGTMFDTLVMDAFRASGLTPPRATVYADGINMRIRMAETGRYLAIVPAGVLTFAAKRTTIKMLPIELPMTHRQVGIITLKKRTLSPLAERFIETVHEVAKSLAKKSHNKPAEPSAEPAHSGER